LLDIGAGDGSLLEELCRRDFAEEYHAVEISQSGLQAIARRNLPKLISTKRFDGYRIEAREGEFDLGLAVHVLEHVEHERFFLREAARVCQQLYIEVPLELNVSIRRSIKLGSRFGHINFYTPETFRSLLKSSGLRVLDVKLFACTLRYEQFVSGKRIGLAKYLLRNIFLRIAPRFAPFVLTYLAGALVCSDVAVKRDKKS
jgi:predicted TPR repeat methyltransferase